MQPGDSITKIIRRVTAAGVAVTGKLTADFAFTGYAKPAGGAVATWSHGSAIAELANGWYAWTYTSPATAGQFGIDIDVASGTDVIYFAANSGENEANDLDSLGAAVSRPIVTVTGQGTIGQITPVSLINKRYRVIRFAFNDASGVAIDMTAGVTYTAYKWCIRQLADQAASPKLDATNGLATAGFTWVITGGLGFVDVKIPEDATIFVADSTIVGAALEARHELIADMVSPASETVPLVQSSPLYLSRREGET